MKIEELLSAVNDDVAHEVAHAYRAHHQVARNIIRDETRLHLQAPRSTNEDTHDSGVSVEIEVAYPMTRWAVIPPGLELATRLARWTPILKSLATSGAATDAMLRQLGPELETIPSFNESRTRPIEAARLAGVLLQHAVQFDLVKYILDVNEDVLGVYRYGGAPGRRSSKIELYWAVIGVIAEVLDVEPQALALVVLAHELAHAYTHLGYDSDGERDGDGLLSWFGSLDHQLRESLAQYYTDRASTRLDARVPGTRRAYELLVEKQPAAYRGHLPWIKDVKPEAMRGTILLARRNSVAKYDAFDALLQKTGRRMRPGGVDSE